MTDKEAAVIDPPTPSAADLEFIRKTKRPVAILLTNKHHTRAAEVLRRNFDSPIWIHESDKTLVEIPIDRTYRNGETLACGLRAITLRDGKTAGETAFLFKGKVPALIVGDAVIGKPEGSISMLPPEKFKDPAKAKEGLRALLKYEFDALLLGDGEPILSNGKSVLSDYLR